MSASTKSGRFAGKALTFNLRWFKRKTPPARTPLDVPTIFTGTSIVISLSSNNWKKSMCKILSVTG
ncbi:hypothetical protein D9M71_674130 [compost metagenome]